MGKVASWFKAKGKAIVTGTSNYIKQTAGDYLDAGKGSLIEAKNRPVRALICSAIVAGGVYAYNTVPSELGFRGTLNEASNDLITTSDAITNEDSNAHVKRVYNIIAKDQLRYQSLGLFSVVYYSEYGDVNRNFISQCKYSNPRWHELPSYVLDVGFLGRWWVMKWKMVDYDINLNEFPLKFESYFQQCSYMIKKALFGTGYFAHLPAQPIPLSYYVDMEEHAKDMVVDE